MQNKRNLIDNFRNWRQGACFGAPVRKKQRQAPSEKEAMTAKRIRQSKVDYFDDRKEK
jgi:hypothetical protein